LPFPSFFPPTFKINNWEKGFEKMKREGAAAAISLLVPDGSEETRAALAGAAFTTATLFPKRGRKICPDFEQRTLSRLVFIVLKRVEQNPELAKLPDTNDLGELINVKERSDVMAQVCANALYSYELVREAAREEMKEPRWIGNSRVQKLKLSDQWVFNVLKRYRLARRRVTGVSYFLFIFCALLLFTPPLPIFPPQLTFTHTLKTTSPTPDDCRNIMDNIALVIKNNNIPPEGVWNSDE
jgi:hypothetical protein